jgi:hypothetical protein
MVQQNDLYENMMDIKEAIVKHMVDNSGDIRIRDTFLEQLNCVLKLHDKDYISVINTLDSKVKINGTQWLQGIIDSLYSEIMDVIPSFK